MFFLLIGFVTKYRNNNKHNLYDMNELQKYPMNMFEEHDVFLKFNPYYFNTSGYDGRFHEKIDNQNEIYNIRRIFYLHNLLQHLQSNIHEQTKLEFVEEYNNCSNDTLLIPDITAAGLFDDWNNEFFI